MPRNWTPEERARQAAAIRRWKPWQQSSGPKTEAGKASASQNAFKHGLRSSPWLNQLKQINAWMRQCQARLKS